MRHMAGKEEKPCLSDEVELLFSTLPKSKGWMDPHIYQYQGIWYHQRFLPSILSFQHHFRPLDADLLLVTNPKSGTTWLKALAFALLNRAHFSSSHEHPLLTNNPHDLVPFLEFRVYKDTSVPDLSHFPSPRLFASHLSYLAMPKSVKESNCRIVYLCRNPKDTFVSFWHFVRDLKVEVPVLFEEAFDMFCEGKSGFGPFWDHALGYWEESLRQPEKVLFLHYEEMKRDPGFCLKKLGEFLRCPISEEEEREGMVEKIIKICSFENLKNLEANKSGKNKCGFENRLLFRRGEVGDWVNQLTPTMIQRLDHLTEKKLFGSSFKFMEA